MKPRNLVPTAVGLTLLLAASAHAQPAVSRLAGAAEYLGSTNLTSLASTAASAATARPPARLEPFPTLGRHARSASLDALPPGDLPLTAESELVAGTGLFGFDALDSYQERYLADHGNQYTIEPPDQALAVGNGFVLEAVNDAVMVYDTKGTALLAAPVSANQFFLQESQINRGTNPLQLGPFLTDPRAYFDPVSRRFFLTQLALLYDVNGVPLNVSLQLVGVSRTANPTQGWWIYAFETTSPDVPGCPCYGDFQQLGVDANGVFISVNLYQIGSLSAFRGVRIYAMSKASLESGASTPLLDFPERLADYGVHPTVIPAGGAFASEANGTEYFASSPALRNPSGIGHAMKLFAISNTASLNSATPSLTLDSVRIPSQRLIGGNGMPPALQAAGDRPLGGANGLNDPLPKLDTGFCDVSATPVYVNGEVWAATGTTVRDRSGGNKEAIAWFRMSASGGAPALAGTMLHQGLVTAPGAISLMYPVIAMPVSGAGAIGVSLSGPLMYPSTAVIPLTSGGTGPIQMSGRGALPDDGYSAYPQAGGARDHVGRWGDYSAAAVDEAGDLWFGSEFIPVVTPANPRATYANWGTHITRAH